MMLKTFARTTLLAICAAALGNAETMAGTCELMADGQLVGTRQCRIAVTPTTAGSDCGGSQTVVVNYRWRHTGAFGASFNVTDGVMSGKCSNPAFENSVTGTMRGGQINGTVMVTLKSGPDAGSILVLKFQSVKEQPGAPR